VPLQRTHHHLAQVKVTTPCTERWDAMRGNAAVRFCGRCEKHVYNLSAMPADAADGLLARTRFGVCVRYAVRSDGTIVTGGCPSNTVQTRPGFALAAALVVSVVNAACASEPDTPNGSTPSQAASAVTVGNVRIGRALIPLPKPKPKPASERFVMGGWEGPEPAPTGPSGLPWPSADALMEAMKKERAALQHCCDTRDANSTDRGVVSLEVDKSGAVSSTSFLFGSDSLTSCVEPVVRAIHFPSGYEPVELRFPFACDTQLASSPND
jgi:hypothetical protein